MSWRIGIAGVSLLAAVAVYVFTRSYPPEPLTAWQSLHAGLAAHTIIFGSAPSLLYTLALGLLIGACASSRSGAMIHCAVWTLLAMLLEVSQARVFAEPVIAWLSASPFLPCCSSLRWERGG